VAGERVAVDVLPPPGVAMSSSQALVEVRDHATSSTVVTLLPGCSEVLALGSGETVAAPQHCGQQASVVGVTLPAGGVVDDNGLTVQNVRVEMAALPLFVGGRRTSEALLAFPGDLSALESSGADAFLESLGAAEIRLFNDDTGAPANLAPGATATLTFTASPDATFDDVIRGWFYDTDARAWVEEGQGVLDADPVTGQLVVRMDVGHFTWWNADKVVERACVTGVLVDEGDAPISGGGLQTMGLSYFGVASATSGGDGRFEVFARARSPITLRAGVNLNGAVVQSGDLELTTGDAIATGGACLDAGRVRIDTALARGCIRATVRNTGTGGPVVDAEVGAFSRFNTVIDRSDTSGDICVTTAVGIPTDLFVDDVVQGVPLRGLRRNLVSPTPGSCGQPASCVDAGFIDVQALGCVAGGVFDINGPVAGAVVTLDGRATLAGARSNGTGDFCAPVEAFDVIDVMARGPGFFERFGETRGIAVSGAGSCAAPASCAQADIVLGNVGCLSGIVRDAGGTALSGVTVSLANAAGGVVRSVTSGAGGAFCLPSERDQVVDVVFDARLADGRRLFSRGRFAVGGGAPATCGGSDCEQLPEVFLEDVSGAGCATGTLLSGPGRPYTDVAEIDIGGVRAAIRPREDGRFCVDIIAGVGSLTDPIERDSCTQLLSTEVTVEVGSQACANEASCTDLGELDFSLFCAGS